MSNHSKWQDNVSVAYWNIDGLFTRIGGQRSCKLDDENFIAQSNKYDIVCLVETHCSPNETLMLENFKIFHTARPKSHGATRHFGGIAICVRNSILKGVNILPSTCSEISWLKFNKDYFNLDSDIFLAAVYISPDGSSFSAKRDNIFEILEDA